MMRISLKETALFFLNNDNFLLLCHNRPDGDTIGSSTALAHALIKLGKKVIVKCDDFLDGKYDFMFKGLNEDEFLPDHIVSVDVADTKLLGDNFNQLYGDKIELCIDHHGSNLLYAKNVYLEPDSASTAEVIYLLLKEFDIQIDKLIASCLFTGISTDTGCFRFSNTTVRTFEIATELIKIGADSYKIINDFFETKTKNFVLLERLALDCMRYYCSDRCALICITRDMFEASGTSESDTDGLADIPRQIEGVLVGVTMRELKDGNFKAQVRTHGDVDASAICQRLGGGGHKGAAGCTLDGPKQMAINTLLKEISAEIDTINID